VRKREYTFLPKDCFFQTVSVCGRKLIKIQKQLFYVGTVFFQTSSVCVRKVIKIQIHLSYVGTVFSIL